MADVLQAGRPHVTHEPRLEQTCVRKVASGSTRVRSARVALGSHSGGTRGALGWRAGGTRVALERSTGGTRVALGWLPGGTRVAL